jgi:hypothetical protein
LNVNRFFRLAAAFLFLWLFTQCSVMYRVLLGVDSTPGWCSNKQIMRDYKRFGIKQEQWLVLDTASYDRWVRKRLQPLTDSMRQTGISNDSDVARQLLKPFRDDLQPVQFRYFTASGEPVLKLVNCYIDPPIPIRWNIDGSFNQHPPRHNIEMLNKNQHPLSDLLPHIHQLDGRAADLTALDSADFVAIVFFNRFMIRPSRKLIKTLEAYRRQHHDVNMAVFYVHNQNSTLWPRLNAKQQEQIKENYLKHP